MQVKKSGSCPVAASEGGTCYDDCDGSDFRCGATQKCCESGCSRKCENATELQQVPLTTLPAIPSDIDVMSRESIARKRAQISWKMPNRSADNADFVLEYRVHIGHTFSEHKLSPWFVIQAQDIQQVAMNFHRRIVSTVALKIGRWYRFRVASISANGTRGYSPASLPFKLNECKPLSTYIFRV